VLALTAEKYVAHERYKQN